MKNCCPYGLDIRPNHARKTHYHFIINDGMMMTAPIFNVQITDQNKHVVKSTFSGLRTTAVDLTGHDKLAKDTDTKLFLTEQSNKSYTRVYISIDIFMNLKVLLKNNKTSNKKNSRPTKRIKKKKFFPSKIMIKLHTARFIIVIFTFQIFVLRFFFHPSKMNMPQFSK